jgi:hypothetical protein
MHRQPKAAATPDRAAVAAAIAAGATPSAAGPVANSAVDPPATSCDPKPLAAVLAGAGGASGATAGKVRFGSQRGVATIGPLAASLDSADVGAAPPRSGAGAGVAAGIGRVLLEAGDDASEGVTCARVRADLSLREVACCAGARVITRSVSRRTMRRIADTNARGCEILDRRLQAALQGEVLSEGPARGTSLKVSMNHG